MIIPKTEMIKAMDWPHASPKPEDNNAPCSCTKAILFRMRYTDTENIILQCPECGRRLTLCKK